MCVRVSMDEVVVWRMVMRRQIERGRGHWIGYGLIVAGLDWFEPQSWTFICDFKHDVTLNCVCVCVCVYVCCVCSMVCACVCMCKWTCMWCVAESSSQDVAGIDPVPLHNHYIHMCVTLYLISNGCRWEQLTSWELPAEGSVYIMQFYMEFYDVVLVWELPWVSCCGQPACGPCTCDVRVFTQWTVFLK